MASGIDMLSTPLCLCDCHLYCHFIIGAIFRIASTICNYSLPVVSQSTVASFVFSFLAMLQSHQYVAGSIVNTDCSVVYDFPLCINT